MRYAWWCTLWMVAVLGTGPVAGQVSVIVTSQEPEKMYQLAEKATRQYREVRRVTGKRTLNEAQRAKLDRMAADLWKRAKQIQADAAAGIGLSLNEQDVLDADLARIEKVCSWLRRRARPPAPPPPASPSPAASPGPPRKDRDG